MKWRKKGLIFAPSGNYDWMISHAQIPVVDQINPEIWRIYFGTRDSFNRTVTTYIEVEAGNPLNVTYIHDQPVLSLGKIGCFDDCGAMPSCIVNCDGVKYLYYTGWNTSTTVPYRTSLGLAVSGDGGITFNRVYEGPVVDRNQLEPHLTASPFVMLDEGIWRMWYTSATGWKVVHGRTEPIYQIKYAESKDGKYWIRNNIICIDYRFEGEANARPSVIKEGGIYKMWYCYRSIIDYRTDREQSYRLGYAESPDGIRWIRKDEEVGINCSEEGWDSMMIAYPYVYEHKGKKYMMYNGNGFGKSGVGYAVLESYGKAWNQTSVT